MLFNPARSLTRVVCMLPVPRILQALGPIAAAGGGSSPARPQRPAAGRDWLPPRQELEAQPVGNKKASGRCRRPPQPTHPPLLLLTAQRTTSSVHCIHLYERRAWKMGGA
jgi:hypothetical protein